jgi:hypothetical protein
MKNLRMLSHPAVHLKCTLSSAFKQAVSNPLPQVEDVRLYGFYLQKKFTIAFARRVLESQSSLWRVGRKGHATPQPIVTTMSTGPISPEASSTAYFPCLCHTVF